MFKRGGSEDRPFKETESQLVSGRRKYILKRGTEFYWLLRSILEGLDLTNHFDTQHPMRVLPI